MKFTALSVSVVATTAMLFAVSAEAGRNNYRPKLNAFNGSQLYSSEALTEATALKRDSQQRRDDAESAIREGDFATRTTFNDFLNRAQNDMFDGTAGDTGMGNLNGTTYSWTVTGTTRTFVLDGVTTFTVDCGTGGC